jgi:17beta-estradiol 17-dehydrogenase / very-long-chain 3-oxoacyl-CoA reductase
MSPIYFIGVVTLILVLQWISRAIYNRWIRKPTSWDQYRGHYAVITGASEGIGEAYAEGLAKRGLNLVVMARTKTKLDVLADKIRSQYQVDVKVLPFDFSQGLSAYETITKELSELKIRVLVNNVGGAGIPADVHTEQTLVPFIGRNLQDADACLIVNCRPTMAMTKIVSEIMRKGKDGRIINVSSLAGVVALPMSAPYSGTKSFIDSFTRSLIPELAPLGIRIESHAPGNVSSSSNLLPVSLDCCTPVAYAEWSLNMFGTGNIVFPYPIHAFLATLMRIVPESLILPILLTKRKKDKQKALEHLQSTKKAK